MISRLISRLRKHFALGPLTVGHGVDSPDGHGANPHVTPCQGNRILRVYLIFPGSLPTSCQDHLWLFLGVWGLELNLETCRVAEFLGDTQRSIKTLRLRLFLVAVAAVVFSKIGH